MPKNTPDLQSIGSNISKYYNDILNPSYTGNKFNIRGSFKPDLGFTWNPDSSFSKWGGPQINPNFSGSIKGDYNLNKNITLSGGVNFKTNKKPFYSGGINIKLQSGGDQFQQQYKDHSENRGLNFLCQ